MDYFEKYFSACTAGIGNQSFFYIDNKEKKYTARAFFKTYSGGRHVYSFLFSNVIDSTYSDGSHSVCNRVPEEWYIDEAKVCVCKSLEPDGFISLTFNGSKHKKVLKKEFFATDGVTLAAEKGDYICIELVFSGTEIPYHPETLVPVFVKNGDVFEESKYMPLPSMIGCDEKKECRIAFWGDSITQGIGTTPDLYRNYASVVKNELGEKYAYWNIGLGYGRASDAASDGAWAYKAKQNDVVTVCFGVNDIFQTGAPPVKELEKAVELLKSNGSKVIIQTVPPFDYSGFHKKLWEETNEYIRNVLRFKADGFLDVTEFLSESNDFPEKAKYGGHPNDEGNEIWGKKLAEEISRVIG